MQQLKQELSHPVGEGKPLKKQHHHHQHHQQQQHQQEQRHHRQEHYEPMKKYTEKMSNNVTEKDTLTGDMRYSKLSDIFLDMDAEYEVKRSADIVPAYEAEENE